MSEKIIITSLLLVVISLTFLYMFFAIDLSVQSGEYNLLQIQIKELYDENLILENQILDLESLTHINQQARLMGFTDAHYIYLRGGDSFEN